MDRIAIIGRPGGGKSTLARKLGARAGLPVIHLDALFWRPGWVESEREPFCVRLAEAMAGDCWITDGNYVDATGGAHLDRAQLILWIDPPRLVCLARALWRAFAQGGGRRLDMAEGCEERIDLGFLHYIWVWDRKTRPRIAAAIARHAPTTPLVVLKDDADIDRWLASPPPANRCPVSERRRPASIDPPATLRRTVYRQGVRACVGACPAPIHAPFIGAIGYCSCQAPEVSPKGL